MKMRKKPLRDELTPYLLTWQKVHVHAFVTIPKNMPVSLTLLSHTIRMNRVRDAVRSLVEDNLK